MSSKPAMSFSAQARKRIDELTSAAMGAHSDLVGTIQEFNNALEAAKEKVRGALAYYNGKLEELKSELESERDQFQSEFDDRTEKWQEGERGEAARSFIDQIEEVMSNLEEVELELPDPIDGEDMQEPQDIINDLQLESEC